MTVAAAGVGGVLLVLKIAFLVLLYLFIWRIVRSAGRDVGALQPAEYSPLDSRTPAGRLVVVESPALQEGTVIALDSEPLTVGRGSRNTLRLEGDEYASSWHARVEPRGDGVWVEDIGSTNGTFVNGKQVEAPRRLQPGDLVRVGSTDFRYER